MKVTTASSLIEGIKRRAAIPENQATFTSSDFLAFADEELILGLVPSIMLFHEDYFLFEIEVPIQPKVTEYELPSRAAGNKLRDLQYKPDKNTYIEMTRIGIGARFSSFNDGMLTSIKHFYMKNNKIVISQSLAAANSGNLVFVFYIKPSQLVLEDRIGVIININNLNNGTTEIVLNSFPDIFMANLTYDFYKVDSPNTILTIDITPVSINSITKSIIFNNSDIPSLLKVGDHLALAGECTIAQIPNEFTAVLEQMVACRVLEAQGDTQGLQNALAKLQSMQTTGSALIENRIDDAPQKVVNRYSLLRSSTRSRRFMRR